MTPKDKAQWLPWIAVDDFVVTGSDGGYWELADKREILGEHDPIFISLQESTAREKSAAERARAEAYEEFSDWIYYDRDEECRGDEDCDHCHFKSMAVQIRAALEQSPSAQAEGEKE